jgi:sphingosine kinase
MIPRKNSAPTDSFHVPYYIILWAEVANSRLTIEYAKELSSKRAQVSSLSYTLEKPSDPSVQIWVDKLLQHAYGASQRRKRIKVLINPHGGQGKASKLYFREIAPIFAAARCELDVHTTQRHGHAVEIAQELDVDSWDVVACCSGDGTPHEVFNGLGKQKHPRRALAKVAVVQLPCGSGNAMSVNLTGTDSPSLAALAIVKGLRTPMDLASVTYGDGQRLLSFLSQAIGIVAESDLATENLRWLGPKRFDVGFTIRAFKHTQWPIDLAIGVELEDKSDIRETWRRNHDSRLHPKPAYTTSDEATELPPLRYGSEREALPEGWNLQPYHNLGTLYAGNMAYMAAEANFFPATMPADGCLDLVTNRGDISTLKSLALADSIRKHQFFDHPLVRYRKVTGYRVVPKQSEGYISVDGERIPFGPFQVEVHQGLGCVLSKSGRVYEARGP